MSADREVICVARMSFLSGHTGARFPLGAITEGQLLPCSDPIVAATLDHWAPIGTADQATAQLITSLGSQARMSDFLPRLGPLQSESATSVTPKRKPGRPPLTRDRVLADLERAIASLRADGVHPSWEALAAAHDGLTEFGLTVDALRKRRDKFPAVFRELVPNLDE